MSNQQENKTAGVDPDAVSPENAEVADLNVAETPSVAADNTKSEPPAEMSPINTEPTVAESVAKEIVSTHSTPDKAIVSEISDSTVTVTEPSEVTSTKSPSESVTVSKSEDSVDASLPSISIQLENAMVGRSYSVAVDLEKTSHADAELPASVGHEFERLGLRAQIDPNSKWTLLISGTILPDTQGDHSVVWDSKGKDEKLRRLNLVLLVNADPKSLWKNIEPSDELPYPKPHTATAQLNGDGYKIIAASRRGRSHAHEGTFRDDDFSIKITDSGWDILIVADGAGSAKFSREGSRLACSTASKYLEEKIVQLLGAEFLILLEDGNLEKRQKEIKQLLYQVLCGAAFAAYKRI